MQTNIENIIKSYNHKNAEEAKLVLRELTQQIILLGLSRSGFFKHASFYGGTALRIFYDLNRYSEDLDFTLNDKFENFSINPYTDKIKEVAMSYGISLEIENKVKRVRTTVDSAFAKRNTYQTFISMKLDHNIIKTIQKEEVIKVKFEIDNHPAVGFNTTNKWLNIPEFAPIVVLDEESLFAGKLHAILCRNYKNTVKGRDYYDFLFFIKRKTKPNLEYLRNKLVETGKINLEDKFDLNVLKKMLKERFEKVDFKQVSLDARRFILQNEDLSYYSKELFLEMVDKL